MGQANDWTICHSRSHTTTLNRITCIPDAWSIHTRSGNTSMYWAWALWGILPNTQHTRTHHLPMQWRTPDMQAHSLWMPSIWGAPGYNHQGSPRPPASNNLWYKGRNRCPSWVCQEKQGISKTNDLSEPIGDPGYKSEQNTTHSTHIKHTTGWCTLETIIPVNML